MTNKEQVIRLGTRRRIELDRKRDLVEIVGITAVLIPVLAFLADGGLAGIKNFSELFGPLSRLSALVGTSLLIVHIALIARIPWIEKTLGLDKLTGYHKRLGKPVLYLLLIHLIFSTLAYAQISGSSPFEAFVDLNLNYLDVLLGTVGFALMLVVVVTSIRIARRKLSYEAWYLVHLLSYAAILLSIPHQLSLGTDFLAQPLLTSYFTLLYWLVGLSVIWFRALQPVVFSVMTNLRVVRVEPAANRTTSISLGGKRISSFGAEAGQFFMVRVMNRRLWWRPHPFSVSSSPSDEIRFTIGNRGDDTALMQDLKPGTRVILEGPYGVFSEQMRTRQHVTLMAAGIGVAPIRALAESLAAVPGDVTVIYRVTDRGDAALLEELERICEERGHNLFVLEGERSADSGFLPTDNSPSPRPDYARLIELSPHIVDSDVYICGPKSWSQSAASAVKKLGIPKHRLHIEEFAW